MRAAEIPSPRSAMPQKTPCALKRKITRWFRPFWHSSPRPRSPTSARPRISPMRHISRRCPKWTMNGTHSKRIDAGHPARARPGRSVQHAASQLGRHACDGIGRGAAIGQLTHHSDPDHRDTVGSAVAQPMGRGCGGRALDGADVHADHDRPHRRPRARHGRGVHRIAHLVHRRCGCNMCGNYSLHRPAQQRGLILGDDTMLKGLGGLGDMAGMMKKAQEMQTKMAEMQDGLENVMVTGESGAGLVKATATAKGELTALDIDPSIFNGDDKEVVEDLILAAIKDAQTKATEKAQEEMGKLTEGLGLPPGMKLPF
mmetsp:Transcript_29009/g.55683  ORF Transcript_29009/g.55683 Transcript_29009/m.55683 type:complete len:314 (+) Transcript_29009:2562-3503(+)